MAVRELVKLSWPDSGLGVARTQAWQERLRVLAMHKPPATPGKPGDLQGARAHLGHDHVAPRGARGHHWAGWSPLHGLCQGVGRSEGDIGGFFRVKKTISFRFENYTKKWRRKGGTSTWWTQARDLIQRRETLGSCKVFIGWYISFLHSNTDITPLVTHSLSSRFYLTPSEGYKQGYTSGPPRIHSCK